MKTLKILEYPLYWEMTNNEKIVLLHLLEEIRPEISIEIGCKEGGSLQLISEFSKQVYSLDIDPKVTSLESKFPNVNFVIGDSKITLPLLLKKLLDEGKSPDFVLIDGQHSTDGVYTDITSILNTKVTKPLTVIMHDSFNPNCRKGMTSIDYNKYKNVHYVDIDFLHGTYSVHEGVKGEMWGGFGLIILKPEKNTDVLEVKQSMAYSFEKTLRLSKHINHNAQTFSDRVKSYLFKKFYI